MNDADLKPSVWRRWRPMTRLLPLLAGGFAVWLLNRQLGSFSWDDLRADLAATPAASVLVAIVLTLVSYFVVTGYDWLGLRYVGSSIPYRRSAPISVAAYGIGAALGYPLFTSTPVRFRFYGALGLGASAIVRLIGFAMVAFWLGLAVVGGGLLVFAAGPVAELAGLSKSSILAVGLSLLGIVSGYLVLVIRRREPIDLGSWRFELPSLRLAAGQLLVSSVEWLLTAAVLWALLPRDLGLHPVVFVAGYLLSQLLGILSTVPGGLGVFEATMILFLSPTVDASAAASAFLLFRAVYYLLPLVLATAVVVFLERRTLREIAADVSENVQPWLGPVVPRALGIATFLAGALLVISGSLPTLAERMVRLDRFLPLGLLESSHLLASVIGLGLLALSRGLRRRLDGAWHLAVGLLAAGIVAALLRGLDWEEATALSMVLVLLLAARRHFYRKASLFWQPFSARWMLAIGVVVAGSFWLGSFAIRNVDYSSELLWRFSLLGDAPRFLRAQVVLVATLVLFVFWRLLRPAPPPVLAASVEERDLVRDIVSRSPVTTAAMALLDDKRFLFDADRRAFIMYGISGDSWISMGDPVGPVEEWPELVWRFREQCDLYDERPVFYQIRPDCLPVYLDAGLAVLKLGESARVPLADFNLDGSARKGLRARLRKAEKESLELEIVEGDALEALLPTLREISSSWLADKNTSEKRFSLGSFQESYLRNFPVAVVRCAGRTVAFCNVLVAAEKAEISVDLMRYNDSAPPGVMDYLFLRLMLWGRDQGYQAFHLGMAPLAGLDQHALAPVWNRLGAWLFRHGEHFYNFQGLREYKDKFDPVWQPRYLAAPDGLATSRALLDVALLISGGARGLLAK